MMYSINCNGNLLDLSTPKVMGILNITPDSFYDGGRHDSSDAIIDRVSQMIDEGMNILDIGAMSSRPGAEIISEDEELSRLVHAMGTISSKFNNLIISIDTLRSSIVEKLSNYPIHIVNDISGGKHDVNMYETCAKYNLAYIMMHMQGQPNTMQLGPQYNDIVFDILVDLKNRIKVARSKGLKDVIIDLGFGFGKTLEHNYTLLKNMHSFKILECPLLAGLSRKSMIYKVLNSTPSEALNGTSALHMVALTNGAKILRVHDVKEAKEVIKLWEVLQ